MAAQADLERMRRCSKDSSETSSITSRELYLSNSLISKLLLCCLHCHTVLYTLLSELVLYWWLDCTVMTTYILVESVHHLYTQSHNSYKCIMLLHIH